MIKIKTRGHNSTKIRKFYIPVTLSCHIFWTFKEIFCIYLIKIKHRKIPISIVFLKKIKINILIGKPL